MPKNTGMEAVEAVAAAGTAKEAAAAAEVESMSNRSPKSYSFPRRLIPIRVGLDVILPEIPWTGSLERVR